MDYYKKAVNTCAMKRPKMRSFKNVIFYLM
jgi:hypothetical protein